LAQPHENAIKREGERGCGIGEVCLERISRGYVQLVTSGHSPFGSADPCDASTPRDVTL
jgi:hypothetical protein